MFSLIVIVSSRKMKDGERERDREMSQTCVNKKKIIIIKKKKELRMVSKLELLASDL